MSKLEIELVALVPFYQGVKASRELNKAVQPSATMHCPVCHQPFVKTHGHRAFCSGAKRGECQYRYWQALRKIRLYALRNKMPFDDVINLFMEANARKPIRPL